MPVSVTMPRLGESVTEGTVTRWLKQEGERVEADEPLLEVSTDKVDTEIPAPTSGTLLETLAEPMARHPLAFGHALCAADMAVHGAVEIALVGNPRADEFRKLASVVGQRFVPSRVLVGAAPGDSRDLPLMEGRELLDGKTGAYVCRGYVCERPVSRPEELSEQLTRVVQGRSVP